MANTIHGSIFPNIANLYLRLSHPYRSTAWCYVFLVEFLNSTILFNLDCPLFKFTLKAK